MNIYVDFDDCLCETARYFSGLAKEMFGLDIPYEQIHYFNLQKSFSLTEDQYVHMMTEAHKPEVLLAYEETPEPPPIPGKKRKGRKPRGKALSLIDRLKKLKGAVCLFTRNFLVPFDNNQAERDRACEKKSVN